jgi:predicted TIM-barrel fold metal-dependent hydrolase
MLDLTRRDLLRATAATGIMLGADRPFGSTYATEDQPVKCIDSHVHVWTPDIQAYPLAKSFQVSDMVPKSFTPDELLRESMPHGVAKIVLIQMNFYEFDNRYMLDCIEKQPAIFSGVGIVDENQPNVVAKMKSLGEQGVRGFRLYADASKASHWKDSEGMNRMWSHASESNQSLCLLANPDALPVVHQMCEQYPMARIVVDHFARIGLSGSVDATDLDHLCRLAKFANVYVKTSAFYALGKKRPPYQDLGDLVQRLVQEFGANRLMWGSDCPYQVMDGHGYADSIGLIRDKLDFLSTDEKRWMLRDTAERVFFA